MLQKPVFATLALLGLTLGVKASSAPRLNVTALGARDGSSTLECWQVEQPWILSSQPGTAGNALLLLGNVSNIIYTLIPPNYDGDVHHAPWNQYVPVP